jgi:hypothetical protein
MTADPGRRRALAARGLAWVVTSRIVMRLPAGSLPRWQGRLDWLAARLPARPICTADEAAWAVTAAARRVPGTRCLQWALALRGMLGHARLPSELRIGVKTGGPGAITAHAWIDSAGRTFNWGDDVGSYSVLRSRAAAS